MGAWKPTTDGSSNPLEVPTEWERTNAESYGPLAPSLTRVYLVVHEPEAIRVVDVADGDEVVFGRSPEATICIDSSRASRTHAVVRRTGAELVLEDLGSRNGTRLNGTKMSSRAVELSGGDVIEIGGVQSVVAVTQARAAADAGTHLAGTGASPSPGVIVADPAMTEVYDLARRVAAVSTTVLVLGETGSGKEVVAEQIHRWSPRADAPFARLNCASLPESLLENELFGHERGAFTGADRQQAGYFEAAGGGTIFLDEIGELTLPTQVKLLGVLENRRVRRLGGTRDLPVDVRVIAATHRDLEADVAAGKFRQDLYYRLSAVTLRVPPLRERPVEISLLAEMFARDFARQAVKPTPVFDVSATRALGRHPWPGNVRELRNAIEHAVVLSDGARIGVEHLPENVRRAAASGRPAGHSMDQRVDDFERREIVEALAAEHGNQSRAARRLGITRRALIYRMEKHGIDR